MPRSRRELLDAAYRYAADSEDCLTELFATVLDANVDLAKGLFETAGLPFGDDVEVRTQESAAAGCRPDLVAVTRADGHYVAQLWSEHKTESAFRHRQMDDYVDALRATGRLGAAIAVVPTAAKGPPVSDDYETLLWQDIAALANDAGHKWGGPGWRSVALEREAPAHVRLLHELVWYLERKGYAVVEALEPDDIAVFESLARTAGRIDALFEQAAIEMEPLKARDELAYSESQNYLWQLFEAPSRSWPERLEADGWDVFVELTLSNDAAWARGGAATTAFGAGVSLDAALQDDLSSRADWMAQAAEADFELGMFDGWLRLYRTKALADVVAAGATQRAQVAALAAWAREAIDNALQLDPGPVGPPKPKRRGHVRPKTENG